jgi:ribosomal protein S12 methylthiotransferase
MISRSLTASNLLTPCSTKSQPLKARPDRRNIGIVSLGCAKNLVDSEKLMKQLERENVSIHFDPSDSAHYDAFIINTCGFIGDAKQESIDHILRLIEVKKSGGIDKLFVMGCLSQRYKTQLGEELPEVDGFYGVNEMEEIVRAAGGDYKTSLLGERHQTTPPHYAYLKIAEGCDRSCSFCAIPAIRGKHLSRPRQEIVEEARHLADAGVKELLIISQDTTYYGVDLNGRRQLPALIAELEKITGLEWIRIHYTYPLGFPQELLDMMKGSTKVCKYIDIPLQHISDRILRSMKRGLTGKKTRNLIEQIRSAIPGIAIRTTFIVGYPGETTKEFEELKQFIRESRFERVGVFTYSPEEDTYAFELKDDIPESEKQRRAGELMAIQEQISLEINLARVGRLFKVIIDREEGEFWIGRTESDSPEIDNEVLVRKNKHKITAGSFHMVMITEATSFDLYGEIITS